MYKICSIVFDGIKVRCVKVRTDEVGAFQAPDPIFVEIDDERHKFSITQIFVYTKHLQHN